MGPGLSVPADPAVGFGGGDLFDPSDRENALCGERIGGNGRVNAVRLCDPENVPEYVVDALCLLQGALLAVSLKFVGDIDETAGIDGIIRSVGDLSFRQHGGVFLLFEQLVVCAAGHRPASETRYSIVVEYAAECARGKHIDTNTINPLGLY